MKNSKEAFKTVDFFRKAKERIAEETYYMAFQALKEYLKSRKLQTESENPSH